MVFISAASTSAFLPAYHVENNVYNKNSLETRSGEFTVQIFRSSAREPKASLDHLKSEAD